MPACESCASHPIAKRSREGALFIDAAVPVALAAMYDSRAAAEAAAAAVESCGTCS